MAYKDRETSFLLNNIISSTNAKYADNKTILCAKKSVV